MQLVATRDVRAFDLRAQRNLDVLNLDDQISTGLHPAVWDTCHRLADAARLWWDDLDAIVYRSRTTPETSVNVAFFAADAFRAELGLVDRRDLMADLVLRYGFTVNWDIAMTGRGSALATTSPPAFPGRSTRRAAMERGQAGNDLTAP